MFSLQILGLVAAICCFYIACVEGAPGGLNALASEANTTIIKFRISSFELSRLETPSKLQKYIQSLGYDEPLPFRKLAIDIKQAEKYFTNPTQMKENESSIGAMDEDSPIKTHTHDTTRHGGPSYTNATCFANLTRVSIISFSSGNAASAAGALQLGTTASLTASSGRANSTAKVTGTKNIDRILVNSTVAGIRDQRIVNAGKQDAFAATSCSAEANGASSSAFLRTPLMFHLQKAGRMQLGRSRSRAFCEAGTEALNATKEASLGVSKSGSAATPKGVNATVVCNGSKSISREGSITYELTIQGQRTTGGALMGNFTIERFVKSEISCK